LWRNLGRLHPRRGVDFELAGGGLLIGAAWPRPVSAWSDPGAEDDFDILQGVVRAVRNGRAGANCPPSKKLAAVILASGEEAGTAGRVAAGISRLANLSSLEVKAAFERPKTAVKVIHLGLEIYLLDVVDVEAERKRLEGALGKRRAELEQTERKLANKGFVDRAPAEVVAEERRRRDASLREIEILERSLADLG
jgi:valyl-tRNA synthetase